MNVPLAFAGGKLSRWLTWASASTAMARAGRSAVYGTKPCAVAGGDGWLQSLDWWFTGLWQCGRYRVTGGRCVPSAQPNGENDMAQMWQDAVPGKYVRVEMPSRWYFGLVTERTQMTVRLEPVCCAHSTGDFGMFLDGQLSEASEVTPMPGALELNLITADTVAEMTAQQFSDLNRRTHKPMKKWAPKD